jgi:hypothetical protein
MIGQDAGRAGARPYRPLGGRFAYFAPKLALKAFRPGPGVWTFFKAASRVP